jgi:hypothetical protein
VFLLRKSPAIFCCCFLCVPYKCNMLDCTRGEKEKQKLLEGLARLFALALCRGVKARLDGSHGARAATGLAVHEPQARLRVPGEVCGQVPAHGANNVLLNVLSEQGLNVLGLVLAAHEEAVAAVNGARGAQLRKKKGQHVLRGTLHAHTNLIEVGPGCARGPHAGHGGGLEARGAAAEERGRVGWG